MKKNLLDRGKFVNLRQERLYYVRRKELLNRKYQSKSFRGQKTTRVKNLELPYCSLSPILKLTSPGGSILPAQA